VKSVRILVACFFVSYSPSIFALEGKSPQKISSGTLQKEVVQTAQSGGASQSGDLDKEVTDIKLRVNSGAKSRYSSSFFLTYSGGSLKDPGSSERAQVGSERLVAPVNLSGIVGLRYRLDKNRSLFLATGVSRSRPFHKTEHEDKMEISTPYVGYDNTFALGDWQISSGYRLYVATEEYQREVGQLGTLGYSLRSLNKIGSTRLNGSISLDAWGSAYENNKDQYAQMQNDFGISLTPALQYNASDSVNVYTSLSLLTYSHYRSDRSFKIEKGIMTQSLGLGYAIRRDFYVAPNLTFAPSDLRGDRTAVSLMAHVNL